MTWRSEQVIADRVSGRVETDEDFWGPWLWWLVALVLAVELVKAVT